MKTKIIVTYGPSIFDKVVLKRVLRYADAIRLNFSHGDKKEWLEGVSKIRKLSKSIGKEVALLADLPGPKIRINRLKENIMVDRGDNVHISYKEDDENFDYNDNSQKDKNISLDYRGFYKDVRHGSIIYLGDGNVNMSVEHVEKEKILCKVINGGIIKGRAGISVYGSSINVEPPTKEDMKLAEFARKSGFDFIGLSFVKTAENVRKVRKYSKELGVIAKMENHEAIKNSKEIILEADGIMVARGDLGLMTDITDLPTVQRNLIAASRKMGKPVIVATQMLANMVYNPLPTRAEVNDIANAVLCGADCLMLSDETSIGQHPVDALKIMTRTAEEAEKIKGIRQDFVVNNIGEGIGYAAVSLAERYQTDSIFAPTHTGVTAKTLSRLRPQSRIIALSSSPEVRRALKIYYGVETYEIINYNTVDQMLELIKRKSIKDRISRYIIVSGIPKKIGATNSMYYIENKK